MAKLFIEELDIKGKKILMRVDFNVPLDNEKNVADATRIEAALPSIRYILEQNGILILMSHLGRPQNQPQSELSLAPIAKVLSAMLNKNVLMSRDCIGDAVKHEVNGLKTGEILLLENLRFHRAEEHPEEDPNFAKELATYGDCYVNDAFGTAHRKHSSTYTITQYFPNKAAAGYLLEKEIHFLGEALKTPQRPYCAIVGGAKISSKIGIVRSLLQKVDKLLIGGGMAYTFLKAKGMDVGKSLLDEKFLPLAEELLENYREKIVLPVDAVIAKEISEDAPSSVISFQEPFPKDYQALDIGPRTIQLFKNTLEDSKTIIWNGPLGIYEIEPYSHGTAAIAQHLSYLTAVTIIGGGDLIAAIKQANVADKMTHLSTGGGATLEFIEFGTLPGIEALSDSQI